MVIQTRSSITSLEVQKEGRRIRCQTSCQELDPPLSTPAEPECDPHLIHSMFYGNEKASSEDQKMSSSPSLDLLESPCHVPEELVKDSNARILREQCHYLVLAGAT